MACPSTSVVVAIDHGETAVVAKGIRSVARVNESA